MPSEDSKGLKKEEVEDGDEKCIGYSKKKKPNNGTPKGAKVKVEKAKKVEKEENDEDFEQPSTKKSSNSTLDKKLKKKKEEPKKKKGTKEAEKHVKKKDKKVYDLPGQKRDSPEERDPLRIFYETLYKQVPNSEMAAIWMMESGLLPKEIAKKVFEKKQRKAQQPKLSSPTKAVITVKRKAESEMTIKKKKTSSSPASMQKKTPDSKGEAKQSKKRKKQNSSSGEESDDDFIMKAKKPKKQKAID